MKVRRRIFYLVVGGSLAFCLAGCSQPAEVLATLGEETLNVADLDAYLLTLPAAARQVPAGSDPAAWMEDRLRGLALDEVLGGSEAMARLEADPEEASRRLWQRSAALVAALARELAREAVPDEEEVAAKTEELAATLRHQPQLNFQHIYFRLDRAATPRARERLRAKARAVAAEAQAGADFATLAREHSESADAAGGGLVVNARPSDLEEVSARALAALEEDEVSGVVETRTGLHVFRLLRRLAPEPPTPVQLETGARRRLQQEGALSLREDLLARLRQQVEIEVETPPWRIGGWTLDAETLETLLPDAAGEDARERLRSHFLLAEEALRRGLETPETVTAQARQDRRRLLDRLFAERRQAFDAGIAEERLRPFYDAQPSLFGEPGKVHLEIIFLPQGRDSFATQKRAERLVEDLRAGASFAELARRESQGPAAEKGGDLGVLEPRQWARLGPAISAAVPAIEVGEISDPVYCTDRVLTRDPRLLRGGFAILRVAERLAERPRSFEEAIDDVRRAYASDHREELDRELGGRILEAADFEILRLPTPDELIR